MEGWVAGRVGSARARILRRSKVGGAGKPRSPVSDLRLMVLLAARRISSSGRPSRTSYGAQQQWCARCARSAPSRPRPPSPPRADVLHNEIRSQSPVPVNCAPRVGRRQRRPGRKNGKLVSVSDSGAGPARPKSVISGTRWARPHSHVRGQQIRPGPARPEQPAPPAGPAGRACLFSPSPKGGRGSVQIIDKVFRSKRARKDQVRRMASVCAGDARGRVDGPWRDRVLCHFLEPTYLMAQGPELLGSRGMSDFVAWGHRETTTATPGSATATVSTG